MIVPVLVQEPIKQTYNQLGSPVRSDRQVWMMFNELELSSCVKLNERVYRSHPYPYVSSSYTDRWTDVRTLLRVREKRSATVSHTGWC